MRAMLLAAACAAVLSSAGCGGNLIGTEFPNGARRDGARPVPQSYYLPMGEVPITLEFDESKQRFDYVSNYESVNAPDLKFGRFNLWHKHSGLSREQMSETVDPKTMLLQKASSIYQPRTNEALIATANLIRQTTELRAALNNQAVRNLDEDTSKKTPPPKCNGVKVAARIPIVPHDLRSEPLTNIVAIEGCEFKLSSAVKVLDQESAERTDVNAPAMRGGKADFNAIAKKCAEAICFRLPVRYEVILRVEVRRDKQTFRSAPAIEPFEVSAPDRTRVAFVSFPRGTFATKTTSLEFSDGVLSTYTVDNESPVVGTMTVATSALLVATAAAELH